MKVRRAPPPKGVIVGQRASPAGCLERILSLELGGIATDLDGHVVYWGKGAEALYGTAPRT